MPALQFSRNGGWAWTTAGILAAALAAALLSLLNHSATADPIPGPQQVSAGAVLKNQPCAVGSSGPFAPTSMEMPGVIPVSPVVALPRDSRGVPDVPPLTEAGKHEFAWDKGPVGVMPGSSAGIALFNTHTWPWGSAPAYGNLMLKGLHTGSTIILRGDGVTQCYRVYQQVETPANGPYPEFYSRTGRPRIAIIVCSGVRAGPGNWLNRTIWYAEPFNAV